VLLVACSPQSTTSDTGAVGGGVGGGSAPVASASSAALSKLVAHWMLPPAPDGWKSAPSLLKTYVVSGYIAGLVNLPIIQPQSPCAEATSDTPISATDASSSDSIAVVGALGPDGSDQADVSILSYARVFASPAAAETWMTAMDTTVAACVALDDLDLSFSPVTGSQISWNWGDDYSGGIEDGFLIRRGADIFGVSANSAGELPAAGSAQQAVFTAYLTAAAAYPNSLPNN